MGVGKGGIKPLPVAGDVAVKGSERKIINGKVIRVVTAGITIVGLRISVRHIIPDIILLVKAVVGAHKAGLRVSGRLVKVSRCKTGYGRLIDGLITSGHYDHSAGNKKQVYK